MIGHDIVTENRERRAMEIKEKSWQSEAGTWRERKVGMFAGALVVLGVPINTDECLPRAACHNDGGTGSLTSRIRLTGRYQSPGLIRGDALKHPLPVLFPSCLCASCPSAAPNVSNLYCRTLIDRTHFCIPFPLLLTLTVKL